MANETNDGTSKRIPQTAVTGAIEFCHSLNVGYASNLFIGGFLMLQ